MKATDLIKTGGVFSIIGYCGSLELNKITVGRFCALSVRTLIICMALMYAVEIMRKLVKEQSKRQ